VLDWAERSESVGQAVAGPHEKKRGARAGWVARRVWAQGARKKEKFFLIC
jgi:hypothetical protein